MQNIPSLILCACFVAVFSIAASSQTEKTFSITAVGDRSNLYLGGNFPFLLVEPPMKVRTRGKDTTLNFTPGEFDVGAGNGTGSNVGLRLGKQINSHIIIAAEIDFMRFEEYFESESGTYSIVDEVGQINSFWHERISSVSISQFDFSPWIRYLPYDSHFFVEGGIAAGVIVRQAITDARTFGEFDHDGWPASDTVPKSMSSNHVDDARLQWTAIVGTGFNIWVSDDFSIDAEMKSRFGLNSLFVNYNMKINYSFEASLGLTYRVW